MTSPQPAALDIAPAMATPPPTDNSPTASNLIDFTAEAQAEAAVSSPQQERPHGPIPLQESPQIIEYNGNGMVEQNGVEAQGQQQGEIVGGAGDAAIPGGVGFDHSVDVPQQYNQPGFNQLMRDFSDPSNHIPNKDELFSGMPIPGSIAMQNLAEAMLIMDQQPYDSFEPSQLVQESQVQAFAKLQFEDGAFFMNTYSLGIGRDQKAAKKALRREQAREASRGISTHENHHEPALSISGEGGIVDHEDDDPVKAERRSKKRSKKTGASKNSQSRSSNSTNRRTKRSSSLTYKPGVYPYQTTRSGADTEAARIDPASLRPDPHSCPLIGIHPKDGDCFKAYKGISRRHVTINYNSTKCVFELHVQGRNGCFIENDGEWALLAAGTVRPLRGGDNLQISGINFTFLLPINATEDTGSEHNAEYEASPGLSDTYYKHEDAEDKFYPRFRDARGKEMSTDHSQEIRATAGTFSSDEESEYGGGGGGEAPVNSQQRTRHQKTTSRYEQKDEEDEEDGFDDEEEEQAGEDEDEEEEEEEPQPLPQEIPRPSIEEDESPRGKSKAVKAPTVPKRSGPGRPPKNGVMSKRAEKEMLKKQAEEAAAAEAKKMDPETSEAPKKGKVGRPRKHPPPNPEEANREKRKYTKRKPKEPQEGATEGTGSGDGASTKVKKERVFKPPRSPTPQYDPSTLTEEQKTKPSENYVVIIYNAMTRSEHKEMGLPQIYNAIKRVYPYFACFAETKGWESSVRHNLSGNPEVFEKGAKDGKGHMWRLKPGASVEKEKKKKPPPELQSYGQPQVIHQAPQNMHQYNPAMGAPYGYGNYPPAPYPGHYMHPPHPPQNGFVPPPGNYPPPYPMTAIPAAIAAPPTAPSSYSSPYGPKPTESNGPQSNDQPPAAQNGQSQATEQPLPKHTSPPAMAPQPQYPPQPQYQAHQGPYPPQIQAPPHQVQYGPPPALHQQQCHPPHQHPTPPNAHQPPEYQPPPVPESQNQPTQPPQTQNQPFQPPQSQNQSPQLAQPQTQPSPPTQGQAQVPNPLQAPAQSPPAVQPTQNQPPPTLQHPLQTQPSQRPAQASSPEIEAKIETMLSEFDQILKKNSVSSSETIDIAIAALRRDRNNAVPDPNEPDKDKARSVKLIIDTLRTSLARISGSGFTAPPLCLLRSEASNHPLPSMAAAPPQTEPLFLALHSAVPASPATPGSIQRPASVSGGGTGSPTAAGAPISAQAASANSPYGANAATLPPVSVLDPVPTTQVPAVSAPVERPTDVDVTMNVGDSDKGLNVNGQQLAGQKRARDESDDLAAEGQENVKRTQLES
ncbi:uncharacterized protein PAC_09650 [Phialocephala subalpina]|uniref:Fork-head domain-containing protein n=1 Tax=Phialocephala subalpina TaxID=576137 RepID=A0A1L7X415_9HELO|nr:uncharacterized protein PAC_09650 [Phialocephala subalpina]